jgi:DNA-binding transcriptional LysR family regulator
VLITYNKASHTYQLLLDRLAKEEVGTPKTMEVREAEAITEMVKVGLGIAVQPPWVVRDDLQAGRLVALTLGRTGMKRLWATAYVQGRQLPAYGQTFIRICRERFSTLMEPDGWEKVEAELPHMATLW